MSYTTLQEKLAKLKSGVELPLDMLREISDNAPFSLWDFCKGVKRPDLREQLPFVSGFRFKFFTELHKKQDGSFDFANAKAIGELALKDGTMSTIRFGRSDFYRRNATVFGYKNNYFPLLKVGKFAYVAEERISLLTEDELIMEGINDHRQNYRQIPEGTLVMVLKTLMFDSIPLAKVLHGEEIGWTYGTLYDKDAFDAVDNENHWI